MNFLCIFIAFEYSNVTLSKLLTSTKATIFIIKKNTKKKTLKFLRDANGKFVLQVAQQTDIMTEQL